MTDYYTMPFISGHGPLGTYLLRFKLTDTATCQNCTLDTAESPCHLLFGCPKFAEIRSKYLTRNKITAESHLKPIYGKEEAIRAFKKFCEIVIKTKKKL